MVYVALYGPRHKKTSLQGLRTTKTQTSLRSLISAFATGLLENILFAFWKESYLNLPQAESQFSS